MAKYEKSIVRDRLKEFIAYCGISVRQFQIAAGLSNSFVASIDQSIAPKSQVKIISAFPDLNMGWLLTGEGTMLKGQQPQQYNSPNAVIGNNNVVQSNNTYGSKIPNVITEKKTAPLVPISLAKRENVDLYKVMREPNLQAEHITRVNSFAELDFYYSVCDDSMRPDFKCGDILALRAIDEGSYIINGNIYVLDTISYGLILRVIKQRGDMYECSTLQDTDRYEPFNVPITDVFRVYNIKGLLRTNV